MDGHDVIVSRALTASLTLTRALAVAIRRRDTRAVLGVAVVVPSARYLACRTTEAGSTSVPVLAADAWREIDAWAVDGDARLPARPAAMTAAVVAALLGEGTPSAVIAERFAAVPIPVVSHADLATLVGRLLPDLLNARRSAS
jgi:hypothetical protein